MLVLTRKTNERIMIGDGVELVVLSVQGNRVRLGIAAPSEVPITRGKLPHGDTAARCHERELALACSAG